ncbi:MAG: GNAT family N-acetyltransferase [Terriglobales bacterium]|jgi:hypothetical protein
MIAATPKVEYFRTERYTARVAVSKNVFVVDPLRDERWPKFAAQHPAGSVFHTKSWLAALNLAYGYEPVVYATCGSASELTSGVVFCKVESALTGNRLVSLPFSDHCAPLVGDVGELDCFLLQARKTVDEGSCDYCEIRPLQCQPGSLSGFARSAQYVSHILDLSPSSDSIFQGLHHSVRRKIRRAEREGLVYEEGSSERLLTQFYKLLVKTRKRQLLPPQPKKWFRSLIGNFGTKLKIRLAIKDGNPIASVLTLSYKDTLTYKYGCSDARFHALGGVALVHWNMIQQAKAEGHQTLDLGRSDISNEGLTTFKERWGGVRSDLGYWRYPNRSHAHEKLAGKPVVGRVVSLLPEPVLIAVGSLLYRHVG